MNSTLWCKGSSYARHIIVLKNTANNTMLRSVVDTEITE